jgi:hypothetical protein
VKKRWILKNINKTRRPRSRLRRPLIYACNLVPRACDPWEGNEGSGIIRFREESDWPLKWMCSSILARIPGFRQRIIPEPSFPSQGSQARGTRLLCLCLCVPTRFRPPDSSMLWTSFNTLQHHSTSFSINQHHSTSFNIVRDHSASLNIIQYHSTSFYIIQHPSTSFSIIQHHLINIIQHDWTTAFNYSSTFNLICVHMHLTWDSRILNFNLTWYLCILNQGLF